MGRCLAPCLRWASAADAAVDVDPHSKALHVVERYCLIDGEAHLDAHGVDHQRVDLLSADRVALPGRRQVAGMWRIQADMAHGVVQEVDDRDLVFALQNLHPKMHGSRQR